MGVVAAPTPPADSFARVAIMPLALRKAESISVRRRQRLRIGEALQAVAAEASLARLTLLCHSTATSMSNFNRALTCAAHEIGRPDDDAMAAVAVMMQLCGASSPLLLS